MRPRYPSDNRHVQLDGLPLPLEWLEPIDGVPMTCREIALMCGLSQQRITQIEQQAIAKLRDAFERHGITSSVVED